MADKAVIAYVADVIPLSHKTQRLLIQRYSIQVWQKWLQFGRRYFQMHFADGQMLYIGSNVLKFVLGRQIKNVLALVQALTCAEEANNRYVYQL